MLSQSLQIEDLENEYWVDIPGFDGYYQISNYSRVKSLRRTRKSGTGYSFTNEKIKKQTKIAFKKDKKIYSYNYYLSLSVDGKRTTFTILQLMGLSFFGEKQEGFVYIHKNKNTLDNMLSNIGIEERTKSMKIDYDLNKRLIPHENMKRNHNKYLFKNSSGNSLSCAEIREKYGVFGYGNIYRAATEGRVAYGYTWSFVKISKEQSQKIRKCRTRFKSIKAA